MHAVRMRSPDTIELRLAGGASPAPASRARGAVAPPHAARPATAPATAPGADRVEISVAARELASAHGAPNARLESTDARLGSRIDRLSAGVVRGRVWFEADAPVASRRSARAESRIESPAIALHARPADAHAAATGVTLGRLLDAEA